MDLILPANWDNSPKMNLILDLTAYFASYQIERVTEYLAEDIKWTLVGDQPIEGKEHFTAALLAMSDNRTSTLTIHKILTYGKEAAVHGEMVMEDRKVYSFADFYEFDSASSNKVKAIVSYVIPL